MAAKDTALAAPLRKLLDEGAATGQFTISDSRDAANAILGAALIATLTRWKMAATHKIPSFSRHWQTSSSGASHAPEQTRHGGAKEQDMVPPRTSANCSDPVARNRRSARISPVTTMCSITARDHCAMGVQVSFMGVGVGSAAVKPGSGP